MSGTRVVIVGAGHAGGSCAALLRQYGFDGPITLVGEEPLVPYQRPPLSKAWLKGEVDADSLSLRPLEFYADHQVGLRLGTRVESLDLAARTVALADGQALAWDRLVLATGSVNRRLPVPGADQPQVLELRSAADADRLKSRMTPGAEIVIVGAGYVGLEVAASAVALGCGATVIEREARVLARVASPELSAFIESYHRARGVRILTGAAVVEIEAGGCAVRLADGQRISGDAVLVGVGAAACETLARAAGLDCRSGVVVDGEARTSDPDVFAIGDCTWRPFTDGSEGRLESVPNALEQAKQAAAAIAGGKPPVPEVPWFWSDQFDLKLQIAGLPRGGERRQVRFDQAAGRFAVFHLDGERLTGVEAINAAPEFMMGKSLIASGKAVDSQALADPSVSMKAVARP